MDYIIRFVTDNVDFTEENFIRSVLYSFVCFLWWIILPHLEFKYKIVTKLTGGDAEKACDFLAYFMIYSGTVRNQVINEMINRNKFMNYGVLEIPIQIASYILMTFGLVLVAFSFYRLGLRGMYFGDHFGFLFKEKIISFPYNYFPHAQYVGTTAFFIGFSLCFHSLAGILISLLIYLLYEILSIIEAKKLEIFYPPVPTQNTNQKTSGNKADAIKSN